jgi:hypothetical protein
MQKWEYLVVRVSGLGAVVRDVIVEGNPIHVISPLPEFLNERGDEGWELVASDELQGLNLHAIYMKRPKND